MQLKYNTGKKRNNGFSILELLVVISIFVSFTMMTLPASRSIFQAQGMDKGVHDLVEFLEFARNEAVARQTYIWVGVRNATVAGCWEIQVAAVYSLDGTGTNISASNLRPLLKVMRIPNTKLSQWSDLKLATRNLFAGGTTESVCSGSSGISFWVSSCQFSNSTVTITPRGEVLLKGNPGVYDGYSDLIDFSIQQTRGMIVSPLADDASVIVNGATGALQVIQIH